MAGLFGLVGNNDFIFDERFYQAQDHQFHWSNVVY
jgi:hypothetical protein